jgi:predicted  nucleic acid-binding Zn-ribbon protein
MIEGIHMENNPNPIEAARTALETAREAHEQAQAALSAFTKSFEGKESTIKREISNEQRRQNSLRQELSKVLDDPGQAEGFEQEIEKTEKLLKRLSQRLELAEGWRGRESEALGELEEAVQAAYTALQYAFSGYAHSWASHVKQARGAYLGALKEYWAEAASRAYEVNFPKFEWKNLEINHVTIRNHCGPIRW